MMISYFRFLSRSELIADFLEKKNPIFDQLSLSSSYFFSSVTYFIENSKFMENLKETQETNPELIAEIPYVILKFLF